MIAIGILILLGVAAVALSMDPRLLRIIAAHLWARAHAIEAARQAHAEMYARCCRLIQENEVDHRAPAFWKAQFDQEIY